MSRFFIDRPIFAIVIAILTVIVGVVMAQRLPVAQYPDIVPPMIQISANYTGADAVTVEQAVATPLEQQVNGVQDMIYLQSINANDGTMTLRVSFEVGTDVNLDQVFTQNRESQAISSLPSEVVDYGLTIKQTVGLPLLVMPIFSPDGSFDANYLGNYATINIVDALRRIHGVGQVVVFGSSDYAMRIWLSADRLAQLSLTVSDVSSAISSQNAVNPAGKIGAEPAPSGQQFTNSVRAQGRLKTAEEFGEIILRENADGSLVRLGDVARIDLGAQTYNQIGRYNGRPASVIAVYQSPGANALATAAKVKTEIELLSQRFPEDMTYAIALDTTLPVSEGISEIIQTLLEAMLLVVVVVFVFLQGWRATLIPLIAVPVSLIGAFAFFPMLGFSLNTLSLLGLVLAIGLVVDDAIVVVEAVEVGIEGGLSPRDAAIKAMDEVSNPVIGIALVLAAVFIPVAFVPGISGRLYQQFAVTIALSVAISAFNALTLSPALAALLLRPKTEAPGLLGRLFGGFNRGFSRVTERYVAACAMMIRRMVVPLSILLILTLLGGGLGAILPTSFVPEEDQGFFLVQVSLPDASSLQRTDASCREVEAVLAKTEGIKSYSTVVGYSLLTSTSTTYAGIYFIQLEPWRERSAEESADALIAKLNRELSALPSAQVFAFAPPAIPGIGTSGGFDVMIQDRSGGTPSYLAEHSMRFVKALNERPEIARAMTFFSPDVPQLFARVDRTKMYKLGVDADELYGTLQTLLGSSYVNQFNRFGRQWRVFLQAEPEYRVTPDGVDRFYVRNKSQEMVPVSALVKMEPVSAPEFTYRFNLFRSAEVLGSPAPGYSSGQAMAAVEEVAKETLPSDMSYAWTNMSYQEKASQGGAMAIFGLSLLFVFLILAALYESWSLPWSVLLTTPIAVFGAFFGLWMRGLDSDVFGQVGLVMLIGLVAKNAILIVEFAKAELELGKAPVDAALAGAKQRLRPILMTSFAFILGCVPLWIATGSGAVSRKMIGTTVIAGMLAATLVAIFIVPALFVLFERLANRGAQSQSLVKPGDGGS